MRTSIKKNFLYNATLNVVNVLFPIITIPYVSRILGVEQIGVFSFVVTIVSYFSLFAALGMPLYGTREIAKVMGDNLKLNKLFNELFSINVISSIFFTVVFCISINVQERILLYRILRLRRVASATYYPSAAVRSCPEGFLLHRGFHRNFLCNKK